MIIGGWGPKRTPRLAAQFAQEFNVPFSPLNAFADQCTKVRDACIKAKRDPETMLFSVAQVICCGENEDEIDRRAAVIGRSVEDLRENAIAGSPSEVLDTIAGYAEAGAQRVYLQCLDMTDLDHISLLGEQVLKLLP